MLSRKKPNLEMQYTKFTEDKGNIDCLKTIPLLIQQVTLKLGLLMRLYLLSQKQIFYHSSVEENRLGIHHLSPPEPMDPNLFPKFTSQMADNENNKS